MVYAKSYSMDLRIVYPDEYAILAEAAHHKPELIWHISGMLQESIKHCMR